MGNSKVSSSNEGRENNKFLYRHAQNPWEIDFLFAFRGRALVVEGGGGAKGKRTKNWRKEFGKWSFLGRESVWCDFFGRVCGEKWVVGGEGRNRKFWKINKLKTLHRLPGNRP